MKLTYKLLVIILLFCPIFANAQARPSMCRIFPLYRGSDRFGPRSSYENDIGQFQLDGSEGETIRSFNYDDLVITVGVNYVFSYSGKTGDRKQFPYRIDLAITVSEKEEREVFESAGSSEASTLYKKGWNLSTTKNINNKKLIYMFTLSCSDGLKLPRRK